MGLFSGKRKHYVASNAMSLMTPDLHAVSDSVLYSVLADEGIAINLINLGLTGMGIKADQLRRLAVDEYTLGLPGGGVHTSTLILDENLVAETIATDLNLPNGVSVESNSIPPTALLAMANIFLQNNRGYDLAQNLVSVPPPGLSLPALFNNTHPIDYAIYVSDVVLSTTDPTQGNITYLVTGSFSMFEGEAGNGSLDLTEFPIDAFYYTEEFELISEIEPSEQYLFAEYYELDGAGIPSTTSKYWVYLIRSNKYPELNPTEIADTDNGMMPVFPIRYNNAWVTGDIATTGTFVLNRIKVEWDTIVDKLAANPDIADIDHAYIMFGIDMQAPTNIGCQYLCEFFDYLADLSAYSPFDVAVDAFSGQATARSRFVYRSSYAVAYTPGIPVTTTITAEGVTVVAASNPYSLTEHGLRIALDYSSITSCIITGSIGEIGTATLGDFNTNDPDDPTYGDSINWLHTNDIVILRHQITTTTYKEVRIYGLIHRNNIYENKEVVTSYSNVVDDVDEHNLVIPIHYAVAKQLNLFDRNILFEESLQIIINSLESVKTKWYQTGWFKLIIFVVVAIIVAYTGQAWLLKLTTAMNLGWAALLKFLLVNILISVAITEGFKLIAKHVGPKVLAILAVIVAIYSMSRGNLTSLQLFGQPITAQTLLSLSASALKAAQTAITKMIDDVSAQYDEFLLSTEDDIKKLEEAQALLDAPDTLVYDMINAQNTAYAVHPLSSDPTKFFNATIHAGNIGTVVLDIIPNFVELSTKLPKPDIYAFGIEPSKI